MFVTQGYPGNLVSSVTYRLAGKCELEIEISATTDQATVVNISNHVYFNLRGHGSGWQGLQAHKLQINAENFTPDDEEYLPTGSFLLSNGFFLRKSLFQARSVVWREQRMISNIPEPSLTV